MARVTKFERDLRAAFSNAPREKVDLALALIRGDKDAAETGAGQRRIRECYNPPSKHDVLMHAIDACLETHGPECLGEVDMHDGPPFEYLNVGDSYTSTLFGSVQAGGFTSDATGILSRPIASKHRKDRQS